MAVSTQELVDMAKRIQLDSEQLANLILLAERELSKSTGALFALTRGSRSGEEAANAVRTAAGSLNKASSSLILLGRASDEFIQNAVK
jgi:hypothetical protein